jgi:hypothetical protein
MKKLILLFVACLSVILLAGAEYPRPYAGSSGPPTKGEMYDSLAAHRNRARLDSIRMNDSLAAHAARIDSSFYWSVLDTLPTPNLSGSGIYIWGIAGDTTSPGLAYKINGTQNKWVRADTSVSARASGMAMDSVNKNSVCRFLIMGTFRKDTWAWTPGIALFSDSTAAGKIGIGGQAAPKKMQYYGQALSATVIKFNPDGTITH